MAHVNTTLIQWYSKKQSITEMLVISAEFVIMKKGIDVVRSNRYKLQIMKVPKSEPIHVYGDNMSAT